MSTIFFWSAKEKSEPVPLIATDFLGGLAVVDDETSATAFVTGAAQIAHSSGSLGLSNEEKEFLPFWTTKE